VEGGKSFGEPIARPGWLTGARCLKNGRRLTPHLRRWVVRNWALILVVFWGVFLVEHLA
jgi:hypothetical protein